MATSSNQRKNDNRGQKRRGGGSRNRGGSGEGRNNQNNSYGRGGRGGRNRSNRNSSATEGASQRQGQRPPRAPVGPTRRKALRPSLWQRLKAFFTGGGKKADTKGEKPNRSGTKKADSRGHSKSNDRKSGSNGQSSNRRKRNGKEAGVAGNSRGKQASATARGQSAGKSGGSTADKQSSKPSRTPEAIEVTSGRLYVGNLSYDATEEDLQQLFNGVGTVTGVEVVCHRYTQRSKGYAFLEMQSVPEAKRAVEELHDKDFMGRPLVVTGAKSKGIRESSETRKHQKEEEASSEGSTANDQASPAGAKSADGDPDDSASSEN